MKTLKFLLIIPALISLNFVLAQTVQEGLKYLENENYTAAENTFKTLAEKEPTNPIYLYYIGEVKYELEDFAGAEKAYNDGLKISSKCAECSIGIGKLKLDQGKVMEAQPIFDAVMKANKKSATIPALIGKTYLTSKNPVASKAIEYLGKSRDMDPKAATTWSLLGNAYKLNNDLGNAMTSYETSVDLDKNNLEAYMSMARIWASSKQTALAIQKLEYALNLNPDYAPAYKDLYELYIRERKFDKVTPLLTKYVALVGNDVDARVRLVKFLSFQAKDYERAIAEGKKLLTTNPEQYTLYRWLAWSYGELEKYQETYENSIKLFNAAKEDPSRKLFQSDTDYYAKAVYKIGKLDEAEIIYQKIVEANPSKAVEIYGNFAKSYYDQKNYEKAIEYYNKKNAVKPLNNADLFYLGLAQYNTSRLMEADSSFAKMLVLTPNYPIGWTYRIRIANKIDTSSTARTWIAKPLHEKYIEYASTDTAKYKPYLIDSYNYLAYYYVQNNDNENAKIYYQKIIDLKPDDSLAVENLRILNLPPGKKQ
jgi:tetratricopeptide (TPR) repeat protein